MKTKLKMLQVEQDVHEMAKLKALKKGMSIKEYIRFLVERD